MMNQDIWISRTSLIFWLAEGPWRSWSCRSTGQTEELETRGPQGLVDSDWIWFYGCHSRGMAWKKYITKWHEPSKRSTQILFIWTKAFGVWQPMLSRNSWFWMGPRDGFIVRTWLYCKWIVNHAPWSKHSVAGSATKFVSRLLIWCKGDAASVQCAAIGWCVGNMLELPDLLSFRSFEFPWPRCSDSVPQWLCYSDCDLAFGSLCLITVLGMYRWLLHALVWMLWASKKDICNRNGQWMTHWQTVPCRHCPAIWLERLTEQTCHSCKDG